MLGTLLASALLLVAALAPSPAQAARGSVVLEPPPAEVRAGDEIELRWTVEGTAPEEMELLLSVDDGRTFAVRVSPQLDGHERTWRWRVPDLPAAAARLRMRVGDEHGESDCAPSAAFRIGARVDGATPGGFAVRVGPPRTHPRAHRPAATPLPGPRMAQAPALVHEGGWWGGFGRLTPFEPTGRLAPSGASFSALGEPPPATVDERGPRGIAPPMAVEAIGAIRPADSHACPSTTAPPSSRPSRIPLRN